MNNVMKINQASRRLFGWSRSGAQGRATLGAALAVVVAVALSACGGGHLDPRVPTPSPSSANGNASALNAELKAMHPILAGPTVGEHPTGAGTTMTTSPLPDPTAESGSRRYQCTTTPYSLTSQPDKIVAMSPDTNKLWVGSLLQGQGYASGLGSLRELPIRQRAPLTIYLDVMGSHVAQVVTNPDAASVQQATADLLKKATDEKVGFPSRLSFHETDADDSTQGELKLGFSAKYLGATVSANLDSKQTAKQSTVMASFVQRLFTVSMVTPATPADYFNSEFTSADLEKQRAQGRISDDNPPVVVGSVSYGRILIYSMTSDSSTSDMTAALNAAYSGGTASGSVNVTDAQQRILNSATYQVAALGGQESDAVGLIKSRKLGDYFASHSDPATAVPISYQVNNVTNDSAAAFTETANYALTTCSPIPNQATLKDTVYQITGVSGYPTRTDGNIYGTLDLNGQQVWTIDANGQRQDVHLHNLFTFRGMSQPTGQSPWLITQVPGQAGPSIIHGTVGCHMWIGGDPMNTYDAGWGAIHEGDVTLSGTSAHCPIDLEMRVIKVRDEYNYTP